MLSSRTQENKVGPLGSDPTDAGDQQLRGSRTGSLVPLGVLAVALSVGALLVAIADDLGRSNRPGSAPLFWVGATMIMVFTAGFALKRRRVTRSEAIGAVFLLGLATYAVKAFYSPIQFTFDDEFSHYITAHNILTTRHLFTPNPMLAISPHYPGLEIVTTAVSFLSGLSIQSASVPVLAAAHMLTIVGVYLLVIEFVPNQRAALLATVAYATTPDFLYFDSYFAYQSLGVPLFVITLLALVRLVKARDRRGRRAYLALTLLGMGATAITHHVSSYIELAVILCVSGAVLIKRRTWRDRWALPGIAALTVIVIEVWGFAVAGGTYKYLQGAFLSRLHIGSPAPTHSAKTTTAPAATLAGDFLRATRQAQTTPSLDRLLLICWGLLLSGLILGAAWVLLRRWRRRSGLMLGMVLAALSVPLAFVLVVVNPSSAGQLESRLIAFSMAPGAVLIGVALTPFLGGLTGRRPVPNRHRVFVLGVVGLLAVGGIAGEWPVFYARVPGPYVLGGRDRSISKVSVELAEWAAKNLPATSIASDGTTERLLSSYGNQPLMKGGLTADLFVSSTFTDPLRERMKTLTLVVVDRRIGEAVPVDARPIFYSDPFRGYYRKPLPAVSLDKFANIPGVSIIFDDGTIVIYDLHGSRVPATG